MKLAYQEYEDISHGVIETADFGFADDPEAMRMATHQLMTGIAKDKIAYAERELYNNSWDEARGDVDLGLPTIWDHTFRIRDYGPGLSPERMVTNYASFFGSSKRGTNAKLGHRGLGSKSPFAYLLASGGGGEFSVDSYHDGQVHHYIMALAAGGMPQIKRFPSTPFEEGDRTGLEVSFAVREDDIYNFQYKAKRILWFSPDRPRVTPDLKFDDDSLIKSGNGWQLHDKSKVPFTGPHVRMGPTGFPIDFEQLGLNDWPWGNAAIVFEAEMGTLAAQTSNEALQYDDVTKTTLRQLIVNFERDLAEQIQVVVVDAEPTYLEACCNLIELSHQLGPQQIKALLPYLTYRGGDEPVISFKITDKHMAWALAGRPIATRFKADNPNDTPPTPDFWRKAKFIIEDKRRYSLIKLGILFDEGKIQTDDCIVWIRTGDSRVLEQFGSPDFIKLDDVKLPYEKHEKANRSKGLKCVSVLTFRNGAIVAERDFLDLSLNHVYVTKSRRRRSHWYYSGNVSEETICAHLRLMHKHGIIGDNFQIIVTDFPQSNWETFQDFKQRVIVPLLDPSDMFSSINLNFDLLNIIRYPAILAAGPADLSALAQRAIAYRDAPTAAARTAELRSLITIDPTIEVNEATLINQDYEALCAKYGLLRTLAGRVYHYSNIANSEVQSLAYYLKLEAGANP